MDEMMREENPLIQNKNIGQELIRKQKETRHRNLSFIFGLIVVIFSLIGFLGCIFYGIGFIRDKADIKKNAEFAAYNEFLLAVAAVDPMPFDDITAADSGELVEIAVWSIIGAELEPDKYDYSSGELAIPVSDIEAAFIRYFGNQLPIKHQSVTGYGYEFTYNEEDGCYYIPLTAIEPLYTPVVTEVENKGDTQTLTMGLINASSWKQDSKTGEILKPDPDKFIKVTLRHSGGSKYIGAIRTTSSIETAFAD
ncbi:MAG: hypothetical protein IKL10_03995 [Clostridia bacterium]|nr:hypothetical protein [Clostridia bacterium]